MRKVRSALEGAINSGFVARRRFGGPAHLRNGRPIYRTRRGLPDRTKDGAVPAFLHVELSRRSDPRGKRINVAAGVPKDDDGVGMIPGGEQGARAIQKRLPRPGNDKLAAIPNFKPAIAQGKRRDEGDVGLRAISWRDISHGAHTQSWPRARRTPRRGLFRWGKASRSLPEGRACASQGIAPRTAPDEEAGLQLCCRRGGGSFVSELQVFDAIGARWAQFCS
jgi:hypothetical protein